MTSKNKNLISENWTNPLPGVPDVESPFFEDLFARKAGEDGWLDTARSVRQNGFAVIDFPDPKFEKVADRIKKKLAPKYDWDGWRNSEWKKGAGLRIQDAWKFDRDVKKIATNETILRLLEYLYGRSAWPFQTLNFPVGTQQHFHTDSVHFSSVPERFMAGIWVALEDVDEECGPLVYYPGSHKLPIYLNEHVAHFSVDPKFRRQDTFEPSWNELVRVYGLEGQVFTAKKGQALIWAANLFHGGMPHKDINRTRWSQVTHYYFENCAYYTPMHSDPFYGAISWKRPTNILDGRMVDNHYLSHRIPDDFMRATDVDARGLATVPSDFDAELYLEANPDVKAAGVDPIQHYLTHGYSEGRPLRSKRNF